MKKADRKICERKHCKCAAFIKTLLGMGIAGLLAYIAYDRLIADKK